MPRKIFVNLPVKDLPASKAFFARLGFTFNAQFTNDDAASLVISDDIYVMLLTPGHFNKFSPLPMADATKTKEVLNCLSCESRAEVDEMIAKAVAAGATTYNTPQDYGFMYGHGFQDLDGHVWELMWMDPGFVQK